ncbi:hypothetical protein TCAL_06894 [Tigriopus californicus]|uniref:Uncharacterized protein n=2 Tax=Tigriopus californicus TaxID=6832 RepID=A0A553PKT5_TIGCA|nr:hypothetical protein TCAL_06894 [Tigriopus californicus]
MTNPEMKEAPLKGDELTKRRKTNALDMDEVDEGWFSLVPLTTDVQFKSTANVTFPDITICPALAQPYKVHVLRKYNLSYSLDFNVRNWQSQLSDDMGVSPNKVFQEATYDLTEGFQFVGFKSKSKSAKFHGKKLNQIAQANVVFKIALGIDAYIHHPGQTLHRDSHTVVRALTNMRAYVDVSHSLTELESVNGEKCETLMNYGFDECVIKGIRTIIGDELNCLVPFVPGNTNETVMCRTDQEFDQATQIFEDHVHGSKQARLCREPCTYLSISIGHVISQVETVPGRTGSGYLKLFFKRNISVSQTRLSYSFMSMVAEIGGYVGFFMGVSVLQLSKWLQSVCDRSEITWEIGWQV